jgi:ABC-type transport system involved in cytochrome c biogenesis permease subunit
LGQANAEAAGIPASAEAERFFGSFFIWILGVLPLPAFKSLAVLGCVNVMASLVFRMPRGLKNAGLWLMHIALLVLLAGSVIGSGVQREYNGYKVVEAGSVQVGAGAALGTAQVGAGAAAGVAPTAAISTAAAQEIRFFALKDSLGLAPVKIEKDSWPYYIRYQGFVEMADGKGIAMYKAYYDPFHVVPYIFSVLFLLGAALHYVLKVRGGSAQQRGGSARQRGDSAQQRGGSLSRVVVPLVALLAALPMEARASARPIPLWEGLHADSPVVVDSVVRPFDSFARGFLDDLSGRVTYKCRESDDCQGKLSAGNVVRQVLNAQEVAKHYRLFKVLRDDVAEALHLPPRERYVSYAELEPSKDLLELYASRGDDHPATAEMKRLYGNLLRYESVMNRSAFTIAAAGKSKPAANSLSASKPAAGSFRLSAEVLYHLLNLALWAFAVAFLAGLLASLNLVFKSRRLDIAANAFCLATTGILVALFTLRLYVAARPPMSSLYEIVLLVALLLMAFESGAFFLCKKRTFALMVPVSLMATALLFFAKFILEPGDTFQPIPAVLNSSVFLTLHVFTIALGFAGMILSGIVAHVALFRFRGIEIPRQDPLVSLLYGTLVFGSVFTVLGTLLGGVWADFAWGRFWGFDPKECGALFVILWAMLALHLRAAGLVKTRGFALFNAFNVVVTFLCWFGVNLLGIGLHSYGFQGGTFAALGSFVLVDTALVLFLNFYFQKHE